MLCLFGLLLTGTACSGRPSPPLSSVRRAAPAGGTGGAAASCIGPQVAVSPPRPPRASQLTVRGHWLSPDCTDTGNFGQEKPYTDLTVELRQGTRRYVLARHIRAGGKHNSIDLRLALPGGVHVGAARLVLLSRGEEIVRPHAIVVTG